MLKVFVFSRCVLSIVLLAQHSLFINFSCLTSSFTVNDYRAKKLSLVIYPSELNNQISWGGSLGGISFLKQPFYKTLTLLRRPTAKKERNSSHALHQRLGFILFMETSEGNFKMNYRKVYYIHTS